MIKRECVDEEHWISEESFRKLLAVYQVLPGPEAHELCVYFGRLRGGKLGGLPRRPRIHAARASSSCSASRSSTSRRAWRATWTRSSTGDRRRRRHWWRGRCVRLAGTFITDVPLAILAVVGLRPDALRGRQLRARSARRRARVRAVDERAAAGSGAPTRSRSLPPASSWWPARSPSR